MTTWIPVLAAAVGGGGLAGVVTSLIAGLLNRPAVKADAVTKLTDSAMRQVDELQERTQEAERAATAARDELNQARRQIRDMSLTVDVLDTRLRMLVNAILAPTADLDRLREMVRAEPGTGPSVNGRHR